MRPQSHRVDHKKNKNYRARNKKEAYTHWQINMSKQNNNGKHTFTHVSIQI